MKGLIITLVSGLPLLLLFSCKKNAEETPRKVEEIIYVNDQLKQYGYFKPGTYWIYQDTVTNTIDSIYVKQNQVSYNTKERNDTLFSYEQIETICAGTYSFFIGLRSDPTEYKEPANVFFLSMNLYSAGPVTNLNNMPFSVASASITSAYPTDSVFVNNTWFKQANTSFFKHLGNDALSYSTGYCHWKKGVGCLVLSSSFKGNNICLKLLRKNIVQ